MDKGIETIAAIGMCAAMVVCACRSDGMRRESAGPAAVEPLMQKTDVHPDEARKLLDEKRGYVYLDVRTPAEFEAGHVPGAINISFADMHAGTGRMEVRPDFLPQTKARLPRDAKVIVGCRSGGRSARACEALRQEGYTNVLNMLGGFGGVVGPDGRVEEPGWTTLGYPVEKGPETPAPKP